MSYINKLDAHLLFRLGIKLDFNTFLSLCETNREIYRKLYRQEAIWQYYLEKDFIDIYDDDEIKNNYLEFTDKPEFLPIYNKSKREYYIFLCKLNIIRICGGYKASLYVLFNKKVLNFFYHEGNPIREIPKEIEILQNLNSLSLARIPIRKIPREIMCLQNLNVLALFDTGIKELPQELFELKNLEKLAVSFGHLCNIPNEINKLQKLKILELMRNDIKDIPKEIGQLKNLTCLSLSTNALKRIPVEIGNLKKLEKLDLSGNNLQTLPRNFGKMYNLKELDLWYNPIKNPQYIKYMFRKSNINITF